MRADVGDLIGGRVKGRGRSPRWHARGQLVCWGPKVIEVASGRRAARDRARRYRDGRA